jgi:hypothetical protein
MRSNSLMHQRSSSLADNARASSINARPCGMRHRSGMAPYWFQYSAFCYPKAAESSIKASQL